MPDAMPMQPLWHMTFAERAEIALFLAALIAAVLLLIRCRAPDTPEPAAQALPARISMPYRWTRIPEVQLITFALPLQLLWEIAQFPLYTVWHEGDWLYILYGLAHCTLGDILILLIVFWVVALLNGSRYWFLYRILPNGTLFTVLGLGYTIFSEIRNVRIKGTWGYTELMPMIPVIDVGGMPFLQWLLIPPVILWLMRMFSGLQKLPNSGPESGKSLP